VKNKLSKLVLVAATALSAAAFATASVAQTADPRAGLKAGVKNPGIAASGISLVTNMPPPPGFTTANFDETKAAAVGENNRAGGGPADGLNLANTDLAFSGSRVIWGNFNGFNVVDVSNPRAPKVVISTVCPGGQGDVGIHGNLLFMSVQDTKARLNCSAGDGQTQVSAERFRGVRIFDISNPAQLKQVAAVQTCKGSHTVTLVPDPKDKGVLYLYNSGNAAPRPAAELAGCSDKEPNDDPNTSLYSIDVIRVPLATPEKAAIVASPRLFRNEATGAINGLAKKTDDLGPNSQGGRDTRNCHDITVFPEIGLAGGACQGNGLLIDISNPAAPKRLDAVSDPNFAAWHSATFSNDGKKMLFTDEWGGGTQPRCRPGDPEYWGGDATFDIVNKKMVKRGYYKIPNNQGAAENCVAHNGSLIPVPGRDIMAQSWYQGGISLVDFTDVSKPVEVGFFDRGPVSETEKWIAGYWSVYWYNGMLYGSEIARGLDILKLEPTAKLTKNEIAAAELVKMTEFNPQTQVRMTWPNKPVVARAYLDQLVRGKAIAADRAAAVDKVLVSLEGGRKESAASLVAQLKADAGKASPADAKRFEGIAAILVNPVI
jgi:hypothetical protein